jgi:hypothetical protein
MQSNEGETWSFHLGSVGCESAAMVRAPTQECQFPNVIEVSLPLVVDSLQSGEIEIRMDLSQILGELKPSQTTTCMFSSIDDQNCQALVNNMRNNTVFSLLLRDMSAGR